MTRDCPVCYNQAPLRKNCKNCGGLGVARTRNELGGIKESSGSMMMKMSKEAYSKETLQKLQQPKEERIHWKYEKKHTDPRMKDRSPEEVQKEYDEWLRREAEKQQNENQQSQSKK